jgi:hypothetical protein
MDMAKDNLIPPVDIPDLSDLQAQAEWTAVTRALCGGGSSDLVAHTLQVNCIRLLDASIRDYSLGRNAILSFHTRTPEQFGIGYIIQATTHFESCIWHLERFIKHIRALRSLKSAESELKALIPRNLSFLHQAAESQITQLRHTLAHLEGTALDGKVPQGTSIALMPLNGGLSISNHVINWNDLVQWLRDAHSCVERLAQFKPLS